MCFQVYLGSYSESPEIPYVAPRDPSEYPEKALYALKVPNDQVWLAKLSTPYRYHLGLMSCGCGFSYSMPPLNDWELNNQIQLVEYITRCLRTPDSVELFSVWSGDENLPIEKHRQITLADLHDPEFYFEHRQMTVVYRDTETLKAATAS